MPHLTFDDAERERLRTGRMEVSRLTFAKGKGAQLHAHPEEQVMYVVSGLLRVECGDETYDVRPGEATLNPGGMPHGVMAVEDTVCLSVKDLVVPGTEATAGDG